MTKVTNKPTLREALNECADKLWVLRCNSPDPLDRAAAEKAFNMAQEALAADDGWRPMEKHSGSGQLVLCWEPVGPSVPEGMIYLAGPVDSGEWETEEGDVVKPQRWQPLPHPTSTGAGMMSIQDPPSLPEAYMRMQAKIREEQDFEIARLRSENDRLLTLLGLEFAPLTNSALTAHVTKLEAAGDRLRLFIAHDPDCGVHMVYADDTGVCTCGRDEALANWRKVRGQV